MILSSNFLHAVTFLHVIHLVLRRQIEIEAESKNKTILMHGYNAGPPMAIPIYTVLPYCVIMYCSRLFVVVFQETSTCKHDVVRQVTEIHLSTKFHVCQQNKKKGEEF